MLLDQLGSARKILMLQGPFGPFFRSIAERLDQAGYSVNKVNLNAGDAWYYPNGLNYTGDLDDWPNWLEELILTEHIEAIIVFGDARIYHMLAHEVALKLGILFLVFEEGYLRPNWITLEPWGVNAHSTLSRRPEDYDAEPPAAPPDQHISDHFFYRAKLSICYYFLTIWFRARFPHYTHHREMSVMEFFRWLFLGSFRKFWYQWRQRPILEKLRLNGRGKTFLMPLQVHNDSQLWLHGGHAMEAYIEQTMTSFAKHAPQDSILLIKHHPLDRAYRNYTKLIGKLAEKLDLKSRVLYVHDIHLPSLFPLLKGTVTVNSSVGMTSIELGVPVKTLGKAIYHIVGLTHQGDLDSFWNNPQPVDLELSRRYRGWLIAKCQLQGAVYLPELLVDPRAFLKTPSIKHKTPKRHENPKGSVKHNTKRKV